MSHLSIPRPVRPAVAAALALLVVAASHGQELAVVPDNARGVYAPGQTIRWNLELKEADVAEASFTLKKGGLKETTQGLVLLTEGKGFIEARLDEPGWLLLEVIARPASDKSIKAFGGALVSPERIQPALPRPDDFDAFWQDKLRELEAIPMKPELTPPKPAKPTSITSRSPWTTSAVRTSAANSLVPGRATSSRPC
jgi:hypothetical protein